jgi:hypothetical protein
MPRLFFLNMIRLKDVLFFGFMFIYIVNITQVYLIYANTVKLNNIIQEEFTKTDNKSLLISLDSQQNRDIFLKSRLLKKKGEIVISTTEIEDQESKATKDQYYRFYNNDNKYNWSIWQQCYFGSLEQRNNCFK